MNCSGISEVSMVTVSISVPSYNAVKLDAKEDCLPV